MKKVSIQLGIYTLLILQFNLCAASNHPFSPRPKEDSIVNHVLSKVVVWVAENDVLSAGETFCFGNKFTISRNPNYNSNSWRSGGIGVLEVVDALRIASDEVGAMQAEPMANFSFFCLNLCTK